MKRIFLLALVALCLPLAAFADGVDFTNNGGTLTGSTAGMSLGGSFLTSVTGLNGGGMIQGPNLGSVTFSTGSLASGSLQMGGTFNAGGSFVISGNGSNGMPSGTIFSGSFSGPVTWTMITLANGTHEYQLTGAISGSWTGSGTTVYGATVQLTINTGKGFFNGKTKISSGDTNIVVVPEPGTLGLLGTGIIGLVGVLHRRMKSSS